MSDVADVEITTSSNVLVNPGSINSEPIITIYGSGDITLIIDDSFIELGIEDSIILNSVIRESYRGRLY